MTATPLLAPAGQLRPAWRRTRWAHPELALAGVAALAWAAVLGSHLAAGPAMPAQPAHLDHHGMAMPGATPALLPAVLLWVVMVTAMMLPTVLAEARFIALNGMWHRRRRGPALFAGAYLAVWSAAGVAVLAAIRPLGPGLPSLWAVAGVLAAAACWEATRWKRRLLLDCHQLRAIPPAGRKADRGCVTEGLRHGVRCLGACGPMMVSMAVAPHHAMLWLMIPLTGVIGVEKLLTRGDRHLRRVAAALAVAAFVVLGVALTPLG